jgi:hypothetical protein
MHGLWLCGMHAPGRYSFCNTLAGAGWPVPGESTDTAGRHFLRVDTSEQSYLFERSGASLELQAISDEVGVGGQHDLAVVGCGSDEFGQWLDHR